MATLLGDLVGIGIGGFVAVAVLSLVMTKQPPTPAFARRSPTSGGTQLRQDHNARFSQDRGFLFRRRVWFVGTCCPPMQVQMPHWNHFVAAQHQRPVAVAQSGARVWWWFENDFYWESGRYKERDVLALIRDRQRKAAQRLGRAHMLLNVDEGLEQRLAGRRQSIPREVRRVVFERDGGLCTECGSNFDLQYDHIIPVALGGASTVENLQLLCGQCNQAKAADL